MFTQPLGVDGRAVHGGAVFAASLGDCVEKGILLTTGTAHGGPYTYFKAQDMIARPLRWERAQAIAVVDARCSQPQRLCGQRVGQRHLCCHGLCVQRGVCQQALALIQVAKGLGCMLAKGCAQQAVQGITQIIACMRVKANCVFSLFGLQR